MRWALGALRFILDEVERVRDSVPISNYPGSGHALHGQPGGCRTLVEPSIVEPLALSDPDDAAVLYAAADGRADILCTTFSSSAGIRLLTDLEAIEELLSRRGDEQ
jgi:hypothetical protein